jgi:RimJ/RimL family protein N-acetyltransferase
MTEDDTLTLVEWRNDPEIMRWMFRRERLTAQQHLSWFRSRPPNRFDYMVCDRINDLPIGTVNLMVDENGVAESGRLIGNRAYLGKGYAREAGRLWLKVGFDRLKLSKVVARTKAENLSNIRLNERLGFRTVTTEHLLLDGTWQDILVMEYTRDEYLRDAAA